MAEKARANLIAASSSLFAKGALVLLQVMVGLRIGSIAVLAEASHSVVDLLAFGFTFWAVRAASKPADEDHAYGHGKAEYLSAAVEAVVILLMAGAIIAESVRRLLQPGPALLEPGVGLALMAVSLGVNLFEALSLARTSRHTGSPALEASSWHWMADVGSSAVVFFSLLALWLGRRYFPAPDLFWIEPAAALAVAAVLGYTAFRLARGAADDLMDRSLPDPELEWLQGYLGTLESPVFGFHDLKTRSVGSQRFVEFHLTMDPGLTVARAHAVNDEIESAIRAHWSDCLVQIHVEPAEGSSVRP